MLQFDVFFFVGSEGVVGKFFLEFFLLLFLGFLLVVCRIVQVVLPLKVVLLGEC